MNYIIFIFIIFLFICISSYIFINNNNNLEFFSSNVECFNCGSTKCPGNCIEQKPILNTSNCNKEIDIYKEELNKCKEIHNINCNKELDICKDKLDKCKELKYNHMCPDMSMYVKKTSIPPCPPLPDMYNYIKKSEIPQCPPIPDMSKFVLKSSIPPCPVIQPTKSIQCPPCEKIIYKENISEEIVSEEKKKCNKDEPSAYNAGGGWMYSWN